MKNLKKRKIRIGFLTTSLLFVGFITVPNVLAASGTTSSSATAPVYVSQWGSSGSGNGQFDLTLDVAANAEGDIYVADAYNQRIQEFTSDGTYIRQWGTYGNGNGQFNQPSAIAIDSSGNVYVADTSNNRIQEFTSDGTYIRQWGTAGDADGELQYPYGIAINQGNIYVTDTGNARVQEFTSDGTYINKWYGGATSFQYPYGIVANAQGDFYVSDMSNDNVQEFTSDGTYIRQWGTYGNGNGQFHYAAGLALDKNGNVYVADQINNRVEIFTGNGNYIDQFGTNGTGNGQFAITESLDIDNQGNIYVVDQNNARVQKFAYTQNLGTVTASGSSSEIDLSLPTGSNISNLESLPSSTADHGYSYPLGLVDFTFNATAGATVPVTLTVQTSLQPNQVAVRKYNPTTKSYASIPGATVTSTTLNGQSALKISYSITDNGSLDANNSNGIIEDPVGLGEIVGNTAVTAPDTGYGSSSEFKVLVLATLIGAIISTGMGLMILYRQRFSGTDQAGKDD